MHLMATYLPFLIHWAFSTSLNVPSPFFATSRYSAATAQGCSGRHPARGTLRGRGSAWRGGQAAPLGPVGTSAPLICPPLPAAPGGRPATRPAPPARGRQSTRARARGRALCISAASRLRQARSGRAPLASSVPGKPPLYLYAPRQRLGLAPTATVRLEAAPEPSQSSMRRRAPWPRLAACRSAGLRRRAQGFYCRPGSPGCLDRQQSASGWDGLSARTTAGRTTSLTRSCDRTPRPRQPAAPARQNLGAARRQSTARLPQHQGASPHPVGPAHKSGAGAAGTLGLEVPFQSLLAQGSVCASIRIQRPCWGRACGPSLLGRHGPAPARRRGAAEVARRGRRLLCRRLLKEVKKILEAAGGSNCTIHRCQGKAL